MEKEQDSRARRTPTGAAVLRREVTDAIRAAVFEELADVGYGRMSIERVARRAGVGKAAVYRRWSSKLPIVLDIVSAVATEGLPTPDSGTLRGDVKTLLAATARVLEHPLARLIVPDLLAESVRNPEMADALHGVLRDTQRSVAEGVVHNAVSRGELAQDTDLELVVDLVVDLACGPLFWRVSMLRAPLSEAHLESLTTATTAALAAAPTS